jgi:transcriptional regulator with XRE-family HTH domain
MLAVYSTIDGMKAARSEPINPESIAAIGDRIRLTREALDLTQAAFARLIGADPQAINNWEGARTRISIDQALKVCRATGVSLDWIYRGHASGLPVNLATEVATLERNRRRK